VLWQIHRFSRLLWKNPKKLGFAWHTKREKAGIRHAKRKKFGLPPRQTPKPGISATQNEKRREFATPNAKSSDCRHAKRIFLSRDRFPWPHPLSSASRGAGRGFLRDSSGKFGLVWTEPRLMMTRKTGRRVLPTNLAETKKARPGLGRAFVCESKKLQE
jgi:hypothetical protein